MAKKAEVTPADLEAKKAARRERRKRNRKNRGKKGVRTQFDRTIKRLTNQLRKLKAFQKAERRLIKQAARMDLH